MVAIACGRRADERQPGVARRPRAKLGVLGEEAVAGMDGVGAARARGVEQRLDVQIALARRRRADRDRLVGEPHVRRVGVGLGVDRDGRDAHRAAGADDAHGDLAAVGDQDTA